MKKVLKIPKLEVLSGRFTADEKKAVCRVARKGRSRFVRDAVLEKLERERRKHEVPTVQKLDAS